MAENKEKGSNGRKQNQKMKPYLTYHTLMRKTDSMGRMHGDAQFAGSSSVPAHVEMMGLIGMGNNPRLCYSCLCSCSLQRNEIIKVLSHFY